MDISSELCLYTFGIWLDFGRFLNLKRVLYIVPIDVILTGLQLQFIANATFVSSALHKIMFSSVNNQNYLWSVKNKLL